jgi:peptidyl-prolyl cis-trans isomerase C
MRSCILTIAFASALLAQNAPPPLLQSPVKPDTVVATVAGVNVTMADIQKMLEAAPQAQQLFQSNPQEAIKQLFLMRHLAEEGEKAQLDLKSPWKEQLDFMRANVLAGAYYNQVRDGYAVSGEQIEDFYSHNQSRWGQAKIKIIFIGFKASTASAPKTELKAEDIANAARQAFEAAHSPSERTEEEASKLASDLVRQLRAGVDFVKLVNQYSDDSSSKGAEGDFGSPVTPASALADDFKKPVLALKQGEISDPIKQSNGFYIVRVEEKSVQPLNSVREPIVQELRQTHFDAWMKEQSNHFQPTVLRPDFFLQPQRYLPPTAPAPAPKQ